jgi:hypothetical protein
MQAMKREKSSDRRTSQTVRTESCAALWRLHRSRN